MARNRHLADDARRTSISLTPVEELALDVIQKRRRTRQEERDTPSEIVADALWRFLEQVEGIGRGQLESLLPSSAPLIEDRRSRVTPIQKKG